jgi:hypothetical protein
MDFSARLYRCGLLYEYYYFYLCCSLPSIYHTCFKLALSVFVIWFVPTSFWFCLMVALSYNSTALQRQHRALLPVTWCSAPRFSRPLASDAGPYIITRIGPWIFRVAHRVASLLCTTKRPWYEAVRDV